MTDPLLRQLRRHRVPTWWRDAKLGIFIHWTPAAVPGFAPTDTDVIGVASSSDPAPIASAPYTEWYENSLRFPDSPVARYHREHYGDRPYASFGGDFDAALDGWDPGAWARTFAATGARYVVLVAKHHDGYCLWPSTVANPHRSGWHTSRDVVGELGEAVRGEGMRFGLYYSGGFDWTFDARPIGTPADIPAAVPGGSYGAYAEAQVRELIERYRPSVLWNDIWWPQPAKDLWRLFRDYYAAVPDGVVNDRWLPRSAVNDLVRREPFHRLTDAMLARKIDPDAGIIPPKPPHFDVRTPEYTVLDDVPPWPWECVRGMDHSFGFNRASTPDDFLGRDELIRLTVDITAKGGNLLLNVGPTGDAAIPAEQQARLEWLASWTQVAGPALFATRPWVLPEVPGADGRRFHFTARGDEVFAFAGSELGAEVVIPGVGAEATTRVEMLTSSGRVSCGFRPVVNGIEVTAPGDGLNSGVFSLTAVRALPR